MAQRAILLSSRSLNGREFPQSILKFLTATEEEAKQYLMDCIDNSFGIGLEEITENTDACMVSLSDADIESLKTIN